MTYDTIRETADAALMPTYGRFSVALEQGKSATVRDAEGREYIDFGSGIGVNSLGYADPEWAAAVAEQAGRLQHISNLYYNETQSLFAQEVCRATGMGRVFLCNSGAEANECAVKLARKYSEDKYGPDRYAVVTMNNSFHGRTIATLEATGQDAFHAHFLPFTGGFRYVEPGDVPALESALEGACAVMLECVQGEGGVKPLDFEYLRQVRRLCTEKDVLLVVDEVQTGVGRTGRFLACEHAGIRPDVVTLAKGLGGGLPIGACLCTEELGGVMSAGMHGSTFGANPVVCAGALQVLERVAQPGFLKTVREKGAYLRSGLEKLPEIGEVRGMGLMLGAALKKGAAAEAAAACVEKGLLVLTAKTLLRFLPPLTITYEELDKGLAILAEVLKNL